MFEISTLKSQRLKLGLTQHQLAKLAGVSQSLLAKLEAGRLDPSYSSVKKIDQALNHAKATEEPTAKDVMIKKVCSVERTHEAKAVVSLLRQYGISQIPVIEKGRILGLVTETGLLEQGTLHGLTAEDVMSDAPPVVPEETRRSLLINLLRQYPCVLVQKGQVISGIVTKSDMVKELL